MPENVQLDGVPVVRLESVHLRVDIAPSIGGRIISLVHKNSGHDFLWRNQRLRLEPKATGSEYDPNFFGGIDELLPNDIPEEINGIQCPDHGELWTTPLTWQTVGQKLVLRGMLALFGLKYQREISVREDACRVDLKYRILNATAAPRQFLWKLHAALAVQAGDVIECPAQTGQVVDLAWSRYKSLVPFGWPSIEGHKANVVPAADGTVDFFYLSKLSAGEIALHRPELGLKFVYEFDRKVFPYAWLFASYGGFDGHYTVILEPCTAMPISVNAAAARKQCSSLEPGEALETTVSIYAGPTEPNDA